MDNKEQIRILEVQKSFCESLIRILEDNIASLNRMIGRLLGEVCESCQGTKHQSMTDPEGEDERVPCEFCVK